MLITPFASVVVSGIPKPLYVADVEIELYESSLLPVTGSGLLSDRLMPSFQESQLFVEVMLAVVAALSYPNSVREAGVPLPFCTSVDAMAFLTFGALAAEYAFAGVPVAELLNVETVLRFKTAPPGIPVGPLRPSRGIVLYATQSYSRTSDFSPDFSFNFRTKTNRRPDPRFFSTLFLDLFNQSGQLLVHCKFC